ncbi:MAG: 3-hydroxyacyl-ACP dehydratase FabZ [Elusimicrobia bacterium]|nr:3-hydroxyacyl-ACP dehydratase FabZ [Elusimicrobiota bacterium]
MKNIENLPQNKPLRIIHAQEILKLIPHRYPFLLIDKVQIYEESKLAVGIKCISANELFFHGHFPNKPVMPGVLILESMAQTAAAMIMGLEEMKGKFAYFAGIKSAKFRKQVLPGDVMKVRVEITAFKRKIGKVKSVAFIDNEMCAEAQLLFAID